MGLDGFIQLELSKLLKYSILGYRMNSMTQFTQMSPQFRRYEHNSQDPPTPEGKESQSCPNPYIAFEKNYPKNIFITLIQHLGERGLKSTYEECVGTRQSFESKNVVSLAEIHKLISQSWFRETINLTALVSNMSNKILMNSKIKKKLFHLLLIKQLFALPPCDCKTFKKVVSRKANEITSSNAPTHPLFTHPSALIYLLHLLAGALDKSPQESLTDHPESDQLLFQDQGHKINTGQEVVLSTKKSSKESSSKQESKLYITKIICSFNQFSGDTCQLYDMIDDVKQLITEKAEEIRDLYNLPKYVPEWEYFNTIVIDNCMKMKRNRQRLTFSMFNQWIMEFRQMTTTIKGFTALNQITVVDKIEPFRPIILIRPPCGEIN